MGYWRAGWQPVGVDNRPQPRYPFPFVQADVLAFLAALVAQGAGLERIGAIHASPPCPGRSTATPEHARRRHPRLIGPTRALLEAAGRPYVIENTPADGGNATVEYLRPDVILCGCMHVRPGQPQTPPRV